MLAKIERDPDLKRIPVVSLTSSAAKQDILQLSRLRRLNWARATSLRSSPCSSRRSGVPVKAMKCAWFDERDYFEFFPLSAVYPKR